MKLSIILLLNLLYLLIPIISTDESLLKGTMISSDENSNLIKYAFDNRLTTQFKSEYESNGWVGINLRSLNIITRIEWGTNETDHSTYLLGIFEGANQRNFEDAIPLYMITTEGKINSMNNIDIEVQIPIQYIRYIGPNGQYCKINNIKIYGYSSEKAGDFFFYYVPSNLPLMIIHTSSGKEPVSREMPATFYIINKINIDIYYSGKINLIGNEKINLYKKNYLINFDDKVSFLDFKTISRKWALISNYGDKTLIRNLVSFEISRIFHMNYTVNCVPIDLMVNGEYKGTYNLCEYIEVSENKIDIQKMTREDILEPDIGGGYLLEIDGFAYMGNLFISSRKGIPVSIRSPNEEDEISQEQIDYIREKFDILENDIYDNNFTNIDMDSFIKYFLIQELIGNTVAFWNTYIYKDRNNDIFYFGPIWDTDMAYDNDKRVYPVNCKKHYIFNYGLSAGTMDKLVNKIISNDTVTENIKKEWEKIINNSLEIEYLENYIDEIVLDINESRYLNFMRWNIMDKEVYFNSKIYGSYEEEINVLKNFIKNRINWMNYHILNKTNTDTFFCEVPIPSNDLDNGLDYDIDDKENNDSGLNYQLLSNSFHFKNKAFLYLSFFNFIFL